MGFIEKNDRIDFLAGGRKVDVIDDLHNLGEFAKETRTCSLLVCKGGSAEFAVFVAEENLPESTDLLQTDFAVACAANLI
jgi:hypothetical protein